MADAATAIAVVILAGGEATRLPGKLSLAAGDVPLLVRVFRNVRTDREIVISCNGTLPPAVDALLDAPEVVDRWPRRGPLSGLISAMGELQAPWVFAVAGDAPFIDAAFIDTLAAQIVPGDEAIVPRVMRAGVWRREPLAALYAREAFVREGLPVLLTGNASLQGTIERLRTRYVDCADERIFTNVNTPQEYEALRSVLS